MDTATAIQTLQALLQTISSNLTGQQAQVDALNLAISQLQGVLITQVDADQKEISDLKNGLAASQDQIATLQNQIIADQNQIASDQQEIATLQAELDAKP